MQEKKKSKSFVLPYYLCKHIHHSKTRLLLEIIPFDVREGLEVFTPKRNLG